jgi:hypothetical protein
MTSSVLQFFSHKGDMRGFPPVLSIVAPAEAGAYLAYRFRLRDVMGPSLRWGDVTGRPSILHNRFARQAR